MNAVPAQKINLDIKWYIILKGKLKRYEGIQVKAVNQKSLPAPLQVGEHIPIILRSF